MAAFPTYAVLLKDGFGVKRNSVVIRTQFEDGNSKQRKRFSRALVERPVTYALKSKTDYTSFISWFNNTINRGADWFDWVNPLNGATLTARIKNGEIDEIPVDPQLNRWDIRFVLEVWDA